MNAMTPMTMIVLVHAATNLAATSVAVWTGTSYRESPTVLISMNVIRNKITVITRVSTPKVPSHVHVRMVIT